MSFLLKCVELPPQQLLDCLSKQLRQRLGLRLFNLDIIREGGAGNQYYVIDINYFPGKNFLNCFNRNKQ
jgi:inositol-1,3,4-trisphosphate 5/6-kinase/inositol-tetrakisphosphate 1-kinase